MNANPQWMMPGDYRRQQFERSLNVGNAGSILVQSFINRVVQQLTLRILGFQAVLRREDGTGDAAKINRRTPGATGAEWVADTATLTDDEGSYAQTAFTYRTLAGRGSVTRRMRRTSASYGDALGREIIGKHGDVTEILESGLITGDAASNANQINGILTLTNAVSGQVVANTTASAGDDLIMQKLDKAIDLVKGSENPENMIILASQLGARQINAAVSDRQRFNEAGRRIAAGFRCATYDDIPIVKSTSMPDTCAIGAAGELNAFTGGNTTVLAVVNLEYAYIDELTALTVEPLAKTDSQKDSFDIYTDLALVLSNTKGAALVTGITTEEI